MRDLWNLLGEEKIKALSQAFYDRVYADEECPWFRDLFLVDSSTPKDLAVLSQVGFLVQRMGGPKYYGGMVKESWFIRDVHTHFRITPKGYERWMHHMKLALDDVDMGPRAEEVKAVLLAYFSAFGKSTINNTDEKAFPQFNGCPFHAQQQEQQPQQEQKQEN